MATSSEILASSGIKFGTSGARGLVEQFTPASCTAFTLAFVAVMKDSFEFNRVAIAIDRRPSSPAMASACAAALHSAGLEVDYYGVIPTPALALKAMQDGVPSIMITGSHIPFDRNGIKFYRPDGEIEKADELAILASDVEVPVVGPVALEESAAARDLYIQRATSLFPDDLLSGKKVGVYEHSAAGREINLEILTALGAEVVSLGRTETFVPIDTEAVSPEDQQLAKTWAAEFGFDAIISTDGDGDRPLIADEKGNWLRGDVLGLLCAKALGIQALAVPVSCNTAIEKSGAFTEVMRTRIGSPYVIEGMQQLQGRFGAVAGFEANGGFLLQSDISLNGSLLKALPTRDAVLPALAVLAEAVKNNIGLSDLVAGLPQRFTASDRLQEFPTDRSQALLAGWKNDLAAVATALKLESAIAVTNQTDGLRLTLENGDVVHLRPSGNAPEFRCYAESVTAEKAISLVQNSLRHLADYRV
ncbi:phosphomannomutase [Oceanobacter mangrovi]|uniref:phosphomannomutase n=1 Tax=Oceanobacter mangrovi TaxID=2862510 RepID=UPI001C8D149A|nr:phosphomannomutase [Oceanobacter mangrovi]